MSVTMADNLDGPKGELQPEEQPAEVEQTPEAPVEVHVAPDNPLAAYVKGGTHTEASARLYEESFREAEKRRDEAERDKLIGKTPIEEGGGRMFAHQFTQNPEIRRGYFLLKYVNEVGRVMPPNFCLADLFMENWETPEDLTVQLVCPMCANDRHKHLQDCQIKIRMSNRRWHHVKHPSPKQFVFAEGDDPPKMYDSAGIITESERFFCPHCNWAGRIVNNTVITERR